LKIDSITLHHMTLPLKHPFETSFGREFDSHFIIVAAESEGVVGYGEVVADAAPLYAEETTGTAWHILTQFLIPKAFQQEFEHPSEVSGWFTPIRRNKMARGGLECALWDLWARKQGISLAKALGGARERIPVGVSVGIDDIPTTLGIIEQHLASGYQRIKVKIKPGHDVSLISAVRKEFGDIPLMGDANSAYTLADLPVLKELDQFGLMMIEQPLAHDDIIDHAKLQPQMKTPICLDESIHSLEDCRKALDLGACRIINIKVGRIGGLEAARQMQAYCQERGVPVWCGGMLESGIGRAHNIAITTLPGFTLPGDTSPSQRYWTEDIISPEVTMEADGHITVPTEPGIGYTPRLDLFPKYTVRTERFTRG
jgi:O-succinylbenzoate synthase